MAIDFDAIRKKLGQLSGTSSKRNTMWRPQEGEEHTCGRQNKAWYGTGAAAREWQT